MRPIVRRLAACGALAVLATLAACATATIEDAVPVSAAPGPPAVEETATADGQPVFSAPGEYPNLNVSPQPAAAQLTEAEREAGTADLRARREQLAADTAATGVQDRAEELRRLAQSHADDALKEIEGQ